MRIAVDAGSFKVAIETEYDGLIGEITDIFNQTREQAGSKDRAILRFIQIMIEHKDEDDAIGYAVMGLLGWYHEMIDLIEDKDIELNLPKIIPHLLNPSGDLTCDGMSSV